MDKDTVKAEVLALSEAILMGKASIQEIERVTRLALDNDLRDFLAGELKDIGRKLK